MDGMCEWRAKIKLVNARGELCYVEIEDEYLKELSAFSILPLNKVVDSIRVKIS